LSVLPEGPPGPPLRGPVGVWCHQRRVDERLETFDLGTARVTLPVPDGAAFTDLEGLEPGARHLTWEPRPGGHFMLSAGTSPGHTPDGLLAGEAERGSGLQVESDAPAPLAGPGARRVVYRVTHHRPEEVVAAADGTLVRVPERDVRRLSDLLFVPGEAAWLRIGYRVDEDAPEALRARLARMLDRVEVATDA
jgi:hypothetical protein